MGHNRAKREKSVRDKYDFVVTGGEYSVFNALLAAADVIVTGGTFTYQFLKDKVTQFGINIAVAMQQAGLDPSKETLYFDKFIFENWANPTPGFKASLPNKFVPYVAARKNANAVEVLIPQIMDQRFGVVGAGSGVIYLSGTNGNLMWYKHDGYATGGNQWTNGGQGKKIGTGWSTFVGLVSAGKGVIYGIRDTGELMWYEHQGYSTGVDQWANSGQGKQVGSGFQDFTHVLATGDGRLYGVKPDGELMWFHHLGHATGTDQWANSGQGAKVGSGFGQFDKIISGGGGVLYGIKNSGELIWYKHQGYDKGTALWAKGGKGEHIGKNWNQFTGIFSGGDGVLYGAKSDGVLVEYEHKGYVSGDDDWGFAGQGKAVGTGWVSE